MSLWGNKDLVYSDGTVQVNLGTSTAQVTGSVGVVTFSTAGIKTGDVITVGAGATYGYAVITGFTSTTLSIASTAGIVTGITTVPSTTYFVSEEPIYTLFDSVYRAPESKTVGYSTSRVFTGVFGVDQYEVGAAAVTSVGGKAAAYAVSHSGWVGIMTYIDTHGNLRVKSEVLVAGGIVTTTSYDASDDSVFKDYAITIVTNPSNRTGILTTANTTFSVVASVLPDTTLTYQWQSSTDDSTWSNLSANAIYSNVTTSTVGIASTTVTGDRPNGTYFRVGVSATGATTVFSNSARLTYA